MSIMQKKWKNIPSTILDVLFVIALTCLSFIIGLDLEEVESITPALDHLSVNWLKAYDFAEIPADYMIYPLQYIGMLVWGMVPFRIFRLVLGVASELPLVLLATWYKLLEIYLLYMVFVYVRKIVEIYRHKQLSNTLSLICVVPIMLYAVLWKGSWNAVIVLLLLIGLYYYLQNRMSLFVIFFLFGLLCHPAVLLFYIPLIFWKNNRLKGIFDYLICLLIPLGMEFMMFASSKGFRFLFEEVVMMQGWLDLVAWIICIIWSILLFFDKKHHYTNSVIYSYILISICLWLANGMKEWYLLLLTVLSVIICILKNNDFKRE